MSTSASIPYINAPQCDIINLNCIFHFISFPLPSLSMVNSAVKMK